MKIAYVEVQNFRKLKSCRVELGEKETIFVGANNSGKTSAMDALVLFLKKERRNDIATTDFTLSHWHQINHIGKEWIEKGEEDNINLDIKQWYPVLPAVDIWLDVKEDEVHYVSHLIPTLSWNGGLLGIRLCFEPKSIEELYKEFHLAYTAALTTMPLNFKLWPSSLAEFLEKRLHPLFGVKAYILDPTCCVEPENGVAKPQSLPENATPLEIDPFSGLFKIDVINAQRGFSDAKSSDSLISTNNAITLSAQLRAYFDKHLNPTELPSIEDLDALSALAAASEEFDKKLNESFNVAITELEGLGYPGFSDPHITLTSQIKFQDALNHDSVVQFKIINTPESGNPVSLPERYNGLGYQNLISMVFKLIRFRDEWMRIGKAGKRVSNDYPLIEPLHLVLIEEPEAHLHAQVQQVFIKKAYDVLRNNNNLKDSANLLTQLIVSTHSSHIAHETDFSCLRYFRKKPATNDQDVPCTTVVNLSKTFGEENETSRFATRYLKTTHCDLFFADAVILVEGPAERMLVPHFIKNDYNKLDSRYITILEIGGSHAHRLKPLIEELGLITLIITDIDSIKSDSQKKVQPVFEKNYRTGNSTLKTWLPKKEKLDELLCQSDDEKISDDNSVRVAYQCPFEINYSEREKSTKIIPYTFEDALVFSNISSFKTMSSSTGLIKEMYDALHKESVLEASSAMFEALNDGKKAEMALELFYLEENHIAVPKYIADGLQWLQEQLNIKDCEYMNNDEPEESEK